MSDILYDIKKVIIEELNPLTGLVKDGIVPIIITCDTQAEISPVVAKGEEKVLRDDHNVLAVARTNDLVYGYDLKLTNSIFAVEFASMIEGGIIRYSGQDIVGYDAPKLVDGDTNIKEFKATIYIANYEGDDIKNYVKMVFNKCLGNAPKLTFKKDFFAPEFDIKARENSKANLTVKSIDYVDTLPVADTTKPTLTMTSAGTITKPAVVVAKSSEIGALYLVPASAVVVSVNQLNTLVAVGIGSQVSVILVATDTNIPTVGLGTGAHKVYAVDKAGNISIGGAITLA